MTEFASKNLKYPVTKIFNNQTFQTDCTVTRNLTTVSSNHPGRGYFGSPSADIIRTEGHSGFN